MFLIIDATACLLEVFSLGYTDMHLLFYSDEKHLRLLLQFVSGITAVPPMGLNMPDSITVSISGHIIQTARHVP